VSLRFFSFLVFLSHLSLYTSCVSLFLAFERVAGNRLYELCYFSKYFFIFLFFKVPRTKKNSKFYGYLFPTNLDSTWLNCSFVAGVRPINPRSTGTQFLCSSMLSHIYISSFTSKLACDDFILFYFLSWTWLDFQPHQHYAVIHEQFWHGKHFYASL